MKEDEIIDLLVEALLKVPLISNNRGEAMKKLILPYVKTELLKQREKYIQFILEEDGSSTK